MTKNGADAKPDAKVKAMEKQGTTLRGDIGKQFLDEFKLMAKPWQQMSEDEQRRLISRADDIAGAVVRGAVDLVAMQGLPALPIEVGKFTVDGAAIKGTFECYADDESLLRIKHLANKRAMFVLASPDAYNGTQKPAEPDNVGDLAMPKERPDAAALATVGRGNGVEKPATTGL